MTDTFDAREHLREWIHVERTTYADVEKFSENHEARQKLIRDMADHGVSEGSDWMSFIGNYIKRAQLLGLSTAVGRQAFGKAIVTMMHALETAIDLYGPMPEPGHTSGELVEWNDGG